MKKYTQTKAWFSAHFHLGHDYDTAITEKDGVVHISCGVMTRCSRDGSRQTRIIDITEDKKLIISTSNGILWEYDCELDDFTGALALDKSVDALCVKDNRLILAYDGKGASVDANSGVRFDCFGGFAEQEIADEETLHGEPLPAVEFTTRVSKEGLYVKFAK